MIDPRCDVETGIHPGPFWYDPNKDLQVCSRHKGQYEERVDEFGPFNWVRGTRETVVETVSKIKSEEVIKKALDAIDEVLNIHENHLFPSDESALVETKERLSAMKNDFRILT